MGFKTSSILLFSASAALLGGVGLAIAFTAAGARAPEPSSPLPVEARTHFPVVIQQREAPKVFTGAKNHSGEPVTVSCASCHATTTPNPALRDAAELKEFHQGMTYNHGGLSCVSCHDPNDYDALRLADGTAVTFPNVMQLCSQCHGPQARDFRNGAHGGMTGFWDLTRGPRQRNNCTDCHDPHSPAYPRVMPVFKPTPAGRGESVGGGVRTDPPKH